MAGKSGKASSRGGVWAHSDGVVSWRVGSSRGKPAGSWRGCACVLGWWEGQCLAGGRVVGPQGFAWGQILQIRWGGIKRYPGATQRALEEKTSNKTRIKLWNLFSAWPAKEAVVNSVFMARQKVQRGGFQLLKDRSHAAVAEVRRIQLRGDSICRQGLWWEGAGEFRELA